MEVTRRLRTERLTRHGLALTRLKPSPHVGRKTYTTLKVYQGVSKSLVVLATGYQTEAQFNAYLGINEKELLASYRQAARRLPGGGATSP